MKKIFIAIAAVVAFSLASCDSSSSKSAETEDTLAADTLESDEVDLEEALQNGDVDAIKAEFDKVKEIAAAGDSAEAKKYAYKLQEFAANHKDDLADIVDGDVTVEDLVNGIKNLPASSKAIANEAKSAATSDAKTVKEDVKTAAKEKANEEVNKGVQKANDEANKAINDAAAAAKKKLGF